MPKELRDGLVREAARSGRSPLGLVTQSSSRSTVKIHAFSKGDPDAVAAVKNSKAAVGPNESRSSDATAEAQEAFWRAYPASVNDISFAATLNAQNVFAARMSAAACARLKIGARRRSLERAL